MASLSPRKVDKTSLVLVLAVLLYLCIWVIPININSDGLDHLMIGRALIDSGEVGVGTPHNPNGPPYPETFHVMLALLDMWGGDGLVKFFPPLCGALIAFFIYAVLKPISKYLGLLSAIFSIGFLTHIFLNPLLEPYLLAGTLASLYFFWLFLKTTNREYLWLALLFLGLSLSIKQQALEVYIVALLVGIATTLHSTFKHRQWHRMKSLAWVTLVPVLISFASLREHVERNGELYDGFARFTYVHWQGLEAVSRVAKEYLLGPAFWQYPSGWLSWILVPVLVLFVLGVLYIYRKDRLLALILLSLLTVETLVTVATGTLIRHYHVVGICITAIFLLSSIFFCRGVTRLRYASVLLALLLVAMGTTGVFLYNAQWWADSGRYDNQHIAMYGTVGDFIRANIAPGKTYLAGARGFAYYSLEEWGTRFWNRTICHETDQEALLKRLSNNQVSYIFLETRQVGKASYVMDYIPPDGLAGCIDESPYFEELFSVESDDGDAFILYGVLYDLDAQQN